MLGPSIWAGVAAVIEDARRRQACTTRTLARRAGVDESTVRRILTGEPVRLSSLRVVATCLGLGWHELLATLAHPEAAPTLQLSGSQR